MLTSANLNEARGAVSSEAESPKTKKWPGLENVRTKIPDRSQKTLNVKAYYITIKQGN